MGDDGALEIEGRKLTDRILEGFAIADATPFLPPSGPARRLAQGPPVTSKFLAANFTSEVFSGATSKGWLLNAVVVQSVPEPSTALLGGLGALALLRRRRTV